MMQRWSPTWTIPPWRPLSVVDEIEMMMNDMLRAPSFRKSNGHVAWAPALEVYERDDKFVVKAEIPGMKREDIKITIAEDTLSISGERESESDIEDDNYYRREISYGNFSRQLVLPSTVDKRKIDAKYDNGILELTLPKVPQLKAKQVEVEVK